MKGESSWQRFRNNLRKQKKQRSAEADYNHFTAFSSPQKVTVKKNYFTLLEVQTNLRCMCMHDQPVHQRSKLLTIHILKQTLFTPVAAKLPLTSVKPFNCFINYVLFDCIDPGHS